MRAARGAETSLRACISTHKVNAVVPRPMNSSGTHGRPAAAASNASAYQEDH